MAEAAELASASLGPRYAPEDPTLPKPWMGLIDGSTGLQYYWNPETNVTQYERPAAAAPPLPPGPPPVATTTPKMSPLPVSQPIQANGAISETSQQMLQQVSQPVQQLSQQIQLQQSVQLQYHQPSLQSNSQLGQQLIHQQSERPFPYQQSDQQSGQHLANHQSGHQMLHQQSGWLLPQQTGQLPQQQSGQQLPHHHTGQQLPHQQSGQQFLHQMSGQLPQQQSGKQFLYQQAGQQLSSQLHQIPYQKIPNLQAQEISHLQIQQPPGQQFARQQMQQPGFQKAEEPVFQHGKQFSYSSTETQPSGGLTSKPNLSSAAHHVQIPQAGLHSLQESQQQIGPFSTLSSQQPGVSLLQMQQNINTIQKQQEHQQLGVSGSANKMGPEMTSNLMSNGPRMGLKEYSSDLHERAGAEFYSNRSKDVPVMGTQHPKLAAIPMGRNLQEVMRTGAVNTLRPVPGHATGFNMTPMRPMADMYNHTVASQPFPSAAPMTSSPRVLSAQDLPPLSSADVYRRQHEVTFMGENVPAPFMTFETTGFPPEILREMHFAGFLSPTPVQAQTWPVALQGRDIVAIAKTGSGKTLGYLIPAFIHLRRYRNNPQAGPTVLVLAPTRELATQIQDEAIKFGRSSRISCICLFGGAPKGPQLRDIERGADIVVATPGRLNDILEMNKINFHQVSFLVLDEADRMLDMGFEPQIRKIVNEIPPRRQTLMYTATWPKEVRKIAGDLLFNPVQVNIGSVDELAANKAITQYVEVVSPMDKQRRLEQILRTQERGSKIIIFCSTKRQCDQLAHSIGHSFGVTAIHGDKSQGERDWALNQFRSGNSPILVATDVAARGLDIKDIRVVINYDFPTGIEDYVHRIGRTGRAGATGVSYTFFSDQDWKYAADLIKVLEGANQRVPPEVREMAAHGAPALTRDRGGIGRWGDSGSGRWDSGGERGMRDAGGNLGGRGGRNDFFGGRAGRGRGFNGAGGWGRGGRGRQDRYGYMDGRGGRFDNQRPMGVRNRDRSYSRSPERGRSWSRNGSRSKSGSWSRSRSRSWTRSRSYSQSRSRTRSRSRSCDKFDGPRSQYNQRPRVSGFDVLPAPADTGTPAVRVMSPMSPGTTITHAFPRKDPDQRALEPDGAMLGFPIPEPEPTQD